MPDIHWAIARRRHLQKIKDEMEKLRVPIRVAIHDADSSTYSTSEVAEIIGVSKKTLLRWLWDEELKEPERKKIGGVVVRIWSHSDLDRARRYKRANYQEQDK